MNRHGCLLLSLLTLGFWALVIWLGWPLLQRVFG